MRTDQQGHKSGIGEIIRKGNAGEVVPDVTVCRRDVVEPVDLRFQRGSLSAWFSATSHRLQRIAQATGYIPGTVSAIENAIGANGLSDHRNEEPTWPPHLRVGTGVNRIALLKDVPV